VKPYTEQEFRHLVERHGFTVEDVSYENEIFGLPLRAMMPEGIHYLAKRRYPNRRSGMRFTVTVA
jgi:hypothetical protein